MKQWVLLLGAVLVSFLGATPASAQDCSSICYSGSSCGDYCTDSQGNPTTCGQYTGNCSTSCAQMCNSSSNCDASCYDGGMASTCGSYSGSGQDSCRSCSSACNVTSYCSEQCKVGGTTTTCGSSGFGCAGNCSDVCTGAASCNTPCIGGNGMSCGNYVPWLVQYGPTAETTIYDQPGSTQLTVYQYRRCAPQNAECRAVLLGTCSKGTDLYTCCFAFTGGGLCGGLTYDNPYCATWP